MTWVIVVIGYLLGSLPTGYIAGRMTSGKDIRRMGDANMGAANVFREMGRSTGILVGLADAAKGALAVILAQTALLSEPFILLTGLAAVLGHNFPIFLGFRGGRGVSTSIGILFVVYTVPSSNHDSALRCYSFAHQKGDSSHGCILCPTFISGMVDRSAVIANRL